MTLTRIEQVELCKNHDPELVFTASRLTRKRARNAILLSV